MTRMDYTRSLHRQAGSVPRQAESLSPPHPFDGRSPNEGAHFVQFYEHEDAFLELLGSFVETGLDAGETCVLFATSAHLEALEQYARTRKRNLAGARASGAYYCWD